MTTTSPKPFLLLAAGLIGLVGISACSSDDDTSSADSVTEAVTSDSTSATAGEQSPASGATISDETIPDISLPGITLPNGVTIPEGAIPAGLEDCAAFQSLFAVAFAGDSASVGDLPDVVDDLRSRVPAELKADVDTVGALVTKLVEVSEEHGDNPTAIYSDPELLELAGDPAFTQAAARLNTWLTNECAAAD